MSEWTAREALSRAACPLLRPCLLIVLGIVLADSASELWWSLPLALLAWAGWKRSIWGAVVAVGVGAFALSHSCQLKRQTDWLSAAESSPGTLNVSCSGTVVGTPRESASGTGFLLHVEEADQDLPPGINLSLFWKGQPVVHGERLHIVAALKRPERPRNPGGFDRIKFLWRTGAPLEGEHIGRLDRLGHVEWRSFIAKSHEWRKTIRRQLVQGLDPGSEEAKLIRAVTLGERPGRSDRVLQRFRNTGTLHIFAVSGLHVGLVALLLGGALRLFGVSRRVTAALLIPVVLAYAAITGFPPAAVRAALMATLFFLAILLRKRGVFFNCMAVSALTVLALDTHQIFQPGFQLSYGVLAVIVLFSGKVMSFWEKVVELDPFLPRTLYTAWQRVWLHFRRSLSAVTASSLVAWIASIPLAGAYFRMFTPVAVVTSVALAAPVMLLMGLAILTLIFSPISDSLASRFVSCNRHAAKICIGIVSIMNHIPLGSWDLQRLFAKQGQLTVFDLRNGGGSIAISEGDGLLIDCGSATNYQSVLVEGLRHVSVGAAHIVITHPGGDAVGGLIAELEKEEVARVWLPTSTPSRSKAFQSALEKATSLEVPLHVPRQNEWQEVSENCRWRVLNAPWKLDGYVLADDWTMIIQLELHGWKFLIAGDAGQTAVEQLLASKVNLQSDVLIINRSQISYFENRQMIDRIDPRVAVLSDQDFPPEFQAEKGLIKLLEERNCPVFLQSEHGAVSFDAGDEKLEVSPYLNDERSLVLSAR